MLFIRLSFLFHLTLSLLLLLFRAKVPPRPAGQRTEPEPNTTFQGFGFGDGGFQMSLGIGAFPFGIFTSTFNFGGNQRPQSMIYLISNNFTKTFYMIFLKQQTNNRKKKKIPNCSNNKTPNIYLDTSTTVQFEEEQFLSKAFLWVTILFLAWLILA